MIYVLLMSSGEQDLIQNDKRAQNFTENEQACDENADPAQKVDGNEQGRIKYIELAHNFKGNEQACHKVADTAHIH